MLTGAVASPARQPESARYLYLAAILLLLIAAEVSITSPLRRRAALVLAGVCVIGLLPNLREVHYGATFFRQSSNQDRAILGAADLLGPQVSDQLPLGIEGDPNAVGDPAMTFSLGAYRAARERHGTPADTLADLEIAEPASREAADRLLARALPIALTPASSAPVPLPADPTASTAGATLSQRPDGCLSLEPIAPTALLALALPPTGLWVRPALGPPVVITMRRFADSFAATAGSAPDGTASALTLPRGTVSHGWSVQLASAQPVVVCGLGASGA